MTPHYLSKLDKNILPAQQLWQIFYYIYLLKDINKLKCILLNPGNSAFIADAIRRLFFFCLLPFSISKLCDADIPSARGKGSFHRRLGGNLSSHALHQALQLSACTDKDGKKVNISMQSITLLRKVWKLVFLDLAPCWRAPSWWHNYMIYTITWWFEKEEMH